MTRRLFNLAAAVSLLLCLAVVGWWAQSYAGTVYGLARADYSANIVLHRGVLYLFGTNGDPEASMTWTIESASDSAFTRQVQNLRSMGRTHWSLWGFEWVTDPSKSPGMSGIGYWSLRVPAWMIVSGASVVPLVWGYRSATTRAKSRLGLCPTCGYDLRATPERCPECGTVVERLPVEKVAHG